MKGRFSGQVAFITGASSGIGAGLARAFAREGADVALLARRVDRLEALSAELRGVGRRALALACDVTKDGELERATARTRQELGKIDVVVANAGFGVVGALERLSLDDYRRQLETNVFGVLRTIYATLPDLKRSRGRLALMGSVSGHVALPGTSAYAMSKFAVRALAESVAHELAAEGISVILLSPGFVESEIRQVDNRGTWHAEARPTGGIKQWLILPTDKAARKMVRAIAARRRERVVTGLGKTAVFLQRHTPWLLGQLVRVGSVRGRREPDARS
jgi:short-subunit dehydrogenase